MAQAAVRAGPAHPRRYDHSTILPTLPFAAPAHIQVFDSRDDLLIWIYLTQSREINADI